MKFVKVIKASSYKDFYKNNLDFERLKRIIKVALKSNTDIQTINQFYKNFKFSLANMGTEDYNKFKNIPQEALIELAQELFPEYVNQFSKFPAYIQRFIIDYNVEESDNDFPDLDKEQFEKDLKRTWDSNGRLDTWFVQKYKKYAPVKDNEYIICGPNND